MLVELLSKYIHEEQKGGGGMGGTKKGEKRLQLQLSCSSRFTQLCERNVPQTKAKVGNVHDVAPGLILVAKAHGI